MYDGHFRMEVVVPPIDTDGDFYTEQASRLINKIATYVQEYGEWPDKVDVANDLSKVFQRRSKPRGGI